MSASLDSRFKLEGFEILLIHITKKWATKGGGPSGATIACWIHQWVQYIELHPRTKLAPIVPGNLYSLCLSEQKHPKLFVHTSSSSINEVASYLASIIPSILKMLAKTMSPIISAIVHNYSELIQRWNRQRKEKMDESFTWFNRPRKSFLEAYIHGRNPRIS